MAGTIDTTFGTNGGWTPTTFYTGKDSSMAGYNSCITDSTGRILVTGYTTAPNGINQLLVARYTASGILDTSSGFGTGGQGWTATTFYTGKFSSGYSLVLDSSNRILVTGYTTDSNGINQLLLVRYTTAGILDTSSGFGTGGTGWTATTFYTGLESRGLSVLLDNKGGIIIAGYTIGSNNIVQLLIARYLNEITITTTTSTTTAPPTTTTLPPISTTIAPPTTTTAPPTTFTNVQFLIAAPFSLLSDPATMAQFQTDVVDTAISVTGAPVGSITLISVTSGSIVIQLRLPTIYVPPLQYAIQNGLFEITIDGVTYMAIPGSFIILDNICFHKGTMILTPSGYKAVERLHSGDLVTTFQNLITKIVSVTSFIGTAEKCPLYVLQKGSLAANKPIMDLYMSGGHAYYHNGRWCHMKCSSNAMKLEEDNIEYYNIALDNYLENTLVANGVEVESLFKMPGLDMKWNCGTDNCKPIITRII
jgi:uncharacterized delta-60 repeat protein